MNSFVQDEELEEFVLEQEQKLKSAVWLQMEFLSFVLRIDEPSEVIDIILDSMEEYYFDFPSIEEYFDRKKHIIIEGMVQEKVDELNQKLMYAIREQMAFLEEFLEVNESKVIIMMDILVYKSILEYLPMREETID